MARRKVFCWPFSVGTSACRRAQDRDSKSIAAMILEQRPTVDADLVEFWSVVAFRVRYSRSETVRREAAHSGSLGGGVGTRRSASWASGAGDGVRRRRAGTDVHHAAGHRDRDQVSPAFQPRAARHSLMTSIIRA